MRPGVDVGGSSLCIPVGKAMERERWWGWGEGPLTPEPLPTPVPRLPWFRVWLTTRPPRFLVVVTGTALQGSPSPPHCSGYRPT